MSYGALASYLEPFSPSETISLASSGSVYDYVGPAVSLISSRPIAGEIWADGRPVSVSNLTYINNAHTWARLHVETQVSAAAEADPGPDLEDEIYEIQWLPVEIPLELHPEFTAGGTYALDDTDWEQIYGWQNEIDLYYKSIGQYYYRDKNGTPIGDPITLGTNANILCLYFQYGITSYQDYQPVWTRQSVYRGYENPSTGACGQKEDPGGSGWPSGYQWRKNEDRAVRVGNRAQWQRYESWAGAKYVWVDDENLY